MVKPKKVAACAMAFTVAMSAVLASGCGQKPKGKGEVIDADSPWYNMAKHTLDLGYDSSEYEYLQSSAVGKIGDLYAIETYGQYKLPSDVNWEDVNFNDYVVENIDTFDEQGNHVSTIDLYEAVRNSGVIDVAQAALDEQMANFDPSMYEDFGDLEDPDAELPEDLTEESDEAEDEAEAEVEAEEETEDSENADETEEAVIDETEELGEGEGFEEAMSMDAADSFYVGTTSIQDDQLATKVTFYGIGEDLNYTILIDPATGDSTYSANDGGDRPTGTSEGIFTIDDYSVDVYWTFEEDNSYYMLYISDVNGPVCEVNVKESLPNEDIYWIKGIMKIDDNNLLVTYTGNGSGSIKYFTVDITTGSAADANGGTYSFLDDYDMSTASYFDGIGNVFMTTEGIQLVDFDSKTVTEGFSFDSCNVNRSDVSGLKLMSYSEDEIVFMGTVFRMSSAMSMTSMDEHQIIVLTKADSNPNAGKTVLKAATCGSIDYAMSEAVCIFNETNPDYFIKFDTRYEVSKHIDGDVSYEDAEAMREAYADAEIELSNQLTVDLMAGEGPDIIFDTSHLSQLNNDDYLVDLSEKINTEGLFSNIIDAAKVDGKLYQIPLTFGVTGVVTHQDSVEAGKTGFTFDEYADFVSNELNGYDPLAMDQTEFFIMCMEAMNEQFVDADGNVNYDNEAFRALAEYTYDNVVAPVEDNYDEEDYVAMENDLRDYGAMLSQDGSFLMMIENIQAESNNATLLGLPSIDGRGPLLSVECSVAISAQAVDVDACWSFVETLTSKDIQEYYAESSFQSPINIEAYEASAGQLIDSYNETIAMYSTYLSAAEIAMYGLDTTPIDESVISSYEDMIASCSSVATTDPAVVAIIREEMPAYFSGQKTLDDVISIMEDRVQTFLDERG